MFSDNILSRRPRDARTDGGIPGPGEAEHRAVAAVPVLDGGLLFRRADVPSIFHICAEDETVGDHCGMLGYHLLPGLLDHARADGGFHHPGAAHTVDSAVR